MPKKIRFPLVMTDNIAVRSLDELREHFNLEAVLEYYENGKLLIWLEDRYLDEVAEVIRTLDKSAPDFQKQLCKAFDVEYTGDAVDLEAIRHRQERLAYLRTITDEDEYLNNIDYVAFNQKELRDLLDAGETTIYLCGEKFTVPAFRKGLTYIGINEPEVDISGKMSEYFGKAGISFTSCRLLNPEPIAFGAPYRRPLRKGGKVIVATSEHYQQVDINGWKGFVSVACDNNYIIGVKSDGNVTVTGDDRYCRLLKSLNWRNIASITCATDHIVGLRKDGTVVAHSYREGSNIPKRCMVEDWQDIVEVACGRDHTVGLRGDGTVVAAGNNRYGRCDVDNWREIVFVACSDFYTMGVRTDGTIITTDSTWCDGAESWNNIISIACGSNFVVGLKRDGTVVTSNQDLWNTLWKWESIISIVACSDFVAGLKLDGTVVIADKCGAGTLEQKVQCWHDISFLSCSNNVITGIISPEIKR